MASWVFGVDLSVRDTATVAGVALTNAGGLRGPITGNIRAGACRPDAALPGTVRCCAGTAGRRDNTGHESARVVWLGLQKLWGYFTMPDLRLHPTLPHGVTAVCGFAELAALADAGRMFRDEASRQAIDAIDGSRCA